MSNTNPRGRPGTKIRAAAVQMDVRLGDVAGNAARVLDLLAEAAANGADLVVFPECSLSGYCFESLGEARPFAVPTTHCALATFAARCDEGALGVTGVLGFLEAEGEGDRCWNSACVAGPRSSAQPPAVYRKTHLPTLGIDRFAAAGDALLPLDVPFGTLGVLICYDIRFPEAPRALALHGADVIALPTNWPVGAESSPDFITRARAWENRVFVVAANRVGVERGRRFIGRSQIVAPSGQVLCEGGPDQETILYADLDLAEARRKRIVYEPGAWELDTTHDRRPDLYGALVEQAGGP